MPIRASSTQNDEGLSQSVESALEDLELKYTSPPTDIEPGIMFLSSSPPKGECVKKLRTVVLSHHDISELGDMNMVARMLKNARDLDLSHNQINDWSEVAALLKVLPKLKSLSLSFNPLMSQIDEKFKDLQHDLEVLELNGVSLDSSALSVILQIFPKLRVLQLCSVAIDHHLNTPTSSSTTYQTEQENQSHPLRDLSLHSCQLDSWEKALKFTGKFEYLEFLDLGNNKICYIRGDPSTNELKRLRILCLNGCPLNGWESLEALAEFPSLEDLRVSEVPFLDNLECDLKHHLLIPRIPNLKVLNGSEITPRYREDCERAFIRYYQTHNDKPPIYQRLVDLHGNLEQLVFVDFTPQETVKTRLKCPEVNRSFCIRHRLHITVSQFLKAISKATDIPLNRLRVLHVTPQYPTRSPDELRPSSQFLHTLRIEDNDEFHVFTKIVPPRPSQRTSESRP
ncbi:unnamed protein product [Bursaphelenchus xylophilus]|uniref:(pine wood nematode) hypothetical protein n=1 Tax=Bursaphelenchus xylophilus TaxID=6326 RepID=A0A1I7SQE6_BURXY|nr:unnamed protein product [Bursaphelenchus xylophilus]CAG9109794.1 unnamed protein product [Bursaphelenchus xylophilus]